VSGLFECFLELIDGLRSADDQTRETHIVGNSPLEEKAQWWTKVVFSSLTLLLLAGWALFSRLGL
jgi:hypothetical protein